MSHNIPSLLELVSIINGTTEVNKESIEGTTSGSDYLGVGVNVKLLYDLLGIDFEGEVRDSYTDLTDRLNDLLPLADEKDAMTNANLPSAANPFATNADVLAMSGGIKGSVDFFANLPLPATVDPGDCFIVEFDTVVPPTDDSGIYQSNGVDTWTLLMHTLDISQADLRYGRLTGINTWTAGNYFNSGVVTNQINELIIPGNTGVRIDGVLCKSTTVGIDTFNALFTSDYTNPALAGIYRNATTDALYFNGNMFFQRDVSFVNGITAIFENVTGNAPFEVASTTQVDSLNAEFLGGFGESVFVRLNGNNVWTGSNDFQAGIKTDTIAESTLLAGITLLNDVDLGTRKLLLVDAVIEYDAGAISVSREIVKPEIDIDFYEEFIGSNLSEVWAQNGAGAVFTMYSEHNGSMRCQTAAIAGRNSYLDWGYVASTGVFKIVPRCEITHRRMQENITNVISRVCMIYHDDNNLIAFRLVDSESVNWRAHVRVGGVDTFVDTTIVADTNFHIFKIVTDDTNCTFYIDDVQRAQIVTPVALKTLLYQPRIGQVETTNGTSKGTRTDYVKIIVYNTY